MDPGLPKVIAEFVNVLEMRGMARQRCEGPDPVFFGNRMLQYGNRNLGVRLILDRSIWTIDVADIAGAKRGDACAA
jgi:hypothetical protein